MDYDGLEIELTGVLNTYFGVTTLAFRAYDDNYDENYDLGPGTNVLLNTVFDARQMPENQNELLQAYDKSLVNVQYVDSIYDDPQSTSIIVQQETIKVICYMQCNMMKGMGGGYQLIACVKNALIGYQPAGAKTRMWISNYGDWQVVDGQLNPFVEFSFRTVSQQVITDNSDPPLKGSGPLAKVDSSLYANDEGPIT